MAENERLDTYLLVDTIIELAKARCGIKKSSSDMLDEEIASVMKFLGATAPDTVWADESPIYGRIGIGIMLSLTLYEFPEFYEEHELSQYN